ncbi:MAG: metal ABC transporter permease [Thermoguttaceae bacterium]
MIETFQLPFVQRAFLVGAIAAIPFGLIGTFVVVRRIGYLAAAIAHCAFGGVGIGIYVHFLLATTWPIWFAADSLLGNVISPISISIVVAVSSALGIGLIRTVAREREDSVIGAIWASSMAIGLLLLERTPGNVSISNYLFGSIYLITREDVITVACLSLIVFFGIGIWFKRLEAVCFDEEFVKIRGISADRYFQILLVLIALTVVILMRLVGIVLVIALVTLPAATASRFLRRLVPMCVLSVFLGFLFTWTGILISLWFDISPGPAIVLVAAMTYFVCLLFSPLLQKAVVSQN